MSQGFRRAEARRNGTHRGARAPPAGGNRHHRAVTHSRLTPVKAGAFDYWWVSRPVHPALRPFVVSIEGHFGTMPSAFEIRAAPVTHPSLIINVGEPFRLLARENVRDAGSGAIGSLVRGLEDRPRQIAHGAASEFLRVRFTPFGAYRVLDLPMDELRNLVVRLEDLWGSAADDLTARIASTDDWAQRFELLETHLLDRADRGVDCAPEVVRGWHLLTASGGTMPVARLAAEVGWTAQHLARRFAHQIGAPPKTVGRVLRFRRAVGRIMTGTQSLAEVAAACGYADQAHMTRDFRQLSGTLPTHAVSERLDDTQRLHARPRGWRGGQPGDDGFY